MCLDYVTPHGFLSAKHGSPCYEQECADKALILTLLRDELSRKLYDDEQVYHPFLRVILRGLLANHARMNPRWSEPNYPFCDILQSLGLVFGFANDNPHLMPSREVQEIFLVTPIPGICWQVYTIVRSVVTTCVDEAELTPWKAQMSRWLLFSGVRGWLMEAHERDPELIPMVSHGLVPGEMAPVD